MTSVAKRLPFQQRPTGPLFAIGLLFLVMVLAACSREPGSITLTGSTMGTYWNAQIAAVPPGLRVTDLRRDIERQLQRVNDEMSTWQDDSIISQFNRAEAGEQFTLPASFAYVLGKALDIAEQTNGAFDPTVGPLVNLWGFGPERRADEPPPAGDIADAMARVGWQRVDFDRETRVLTQTGDVYLDLSGIAKGYGVDRVSELLLSRGVRGFLVDIGGDIRTHGVRGDRRPWRVAVERPMAGERSIQTIVEPGDAAMVTSGTYRQFFEADGQRFSHTIDPRTGYPVAHQVVSVTVIAENATLADALATGLGVPAPDEAMAIATEHDYAVLWLLYIDGEVVEQHSSAFAPFLDQE